MQVLYKFIIFLMFMLATNSTYAINIITNGDFENGNTGFFSDYTNTTFALGAQEYALTTNPRNSNGSFASYGDNTTGSGLMMMVNAASAANQVVWGQNVNVTANTDYDFSLFISSWTNIAPGHLRFLVNNNSIGEFQASTTTGVWEQFSTSFNSGNATTLSITIIDLTNESFGDDFALDDISLTANVPEPSTYLFMVVACMLLLVRSSKQNNQ